METCCGYGYGLARKSVKGISPPTCFLLDKSKKLDVVSTVSSARGRANLDGPPVLLNMYQFFKRRQRAYYPRRKQLPSCEACRLLNLGFRPRLHFQGPTTAHGTPQEPRRSTLPRPYRLASSFQGHGVLNRKENSFPDRRQCMQGHSRYQDRYTLARRLGDVLSGTRFWNKYQIPFRLRIYNGCAANA